MFDRDIRVTLPVEVVRKTPLHTTYFHPGTRRAARARAEAIARTSSQLATKTLTDDEFNTLVHQAGTDAYNRTDTSIRIGERVVTLCWNLTTYNSVVYLVYGASIFHRDHTCEEWSRHQHRATAYGRAMLNPVVVPLVEVLQQVDAKTRALLDADETMTSTLVRVIRTQLLPIFGTDAKSLAWRRHNYREQARAAALKVAMRGTGV